jgi:hypothetical protein
MARGKLRAKLPALRLAWQGRIQEQHRFLLREWLDHARHLPCQLVKSTAQWRAGPSPS